MSLELITPLAVSSWQAWTVLAVLTAFVVAVVAEPALLAAPAVAAPFAERRVAQTAHGSAEVAPAAAVAEQLQVAGAVVAAISSFVVVAHDASVALAESDYAVARAASASAVAQPRVAAAATESFVVSQLHVASALVVARFVSGPADEAVVLLVGPGPASLRVRTLAACASPATAGARSYRRGLPVSTNQPSAARALAQPRYCLAELFALELPHADQILAASGCGLDRLLARLA